MSSPERNTDPLDIASEREQEFREKALADVRASMVQRHPDFNGRNCIDCEAEISILRLDMGRIRCVACQSDEDKREKQRGKR